MGRRRPGGSPPPGRYRRAWSTPDGRASGRVRARVRSRLRSPDVVDRLCDCPQDVTAERLTQRSITAVVRSRGGESTSPEIPDGRRLGALSRASRSRQFSDSAPPSKRGSETQPEAEEDDTETRPNQCPSKTRLHDREDDSQQARRQVPEGRDSWPSHKWALPPRPGVPGLGRRHRYSIGTEESRLDRVRTMQEHAARRTRHTQRGCRLRRGPAIGRFSPLTDSAADSRCRS